MLLESKDILVFYYTSLLRDSCSEVSSSIPIPFLYRQINYLDEGYPAGGKNNTEDSRKSITKNILKTTLQKMLEDIVSALNPEWYFIELIYNDSFICISFVSCPLLWKLKRKKRLIYILKFLFLKKKQKRHALTETQ